jgi:hypothetical protein
MQSKSDPKPLAPDRMRALFAAAAVRAKDTKVVVCMVRTTLQNRTKRKPEKPV